MNNPPGAPNLSRRNFLLRCSKAGLSAAAACSLGYAFFDPSGPKASQPQREGVVLPDFAVASAHSKMSIVRGADRKITIERAFEALGGVGAFIQKDDRVLLKVNAAFATPPVLGATTHPDLVEAVSRLCYQAGASEVVVTDNPINDPASSFALTGIGRAAEAAGARVVLPRETSFRPAMIPQTQLLQNWPILFEPFQKINKVIGMAPVKDHHRSGASMTLKNWYGLLGGRRNIFHQDIHNLIMELGLMIKPTLVILDGTVSMMANGPTGGSLSDLKSTHTMIVSTDPVAADAFGAELLEKSVHDLPFIAKAEAAGVGVADYRSLDLREITNS